MGYQHGAQAAALIQGYLLWIERITGRPRDELGRKAMAFLPFIEALSPAFVAEVRGLADGAGISFAEALLCQARGEAARVAEGGCTAFALTGSATADGQPLAGQNQDLEPEYADLAILLHVRPSDGRPRALLFTFAGQLGYSGMNQYGVAQFMNALYDFTWRLALPRYPLKRVLLEKKNVGECLDLLAQYRTCSADNVVLCDGEGRIADVETRPEGIAQWRGEWGDGCVHANHYLTPQFVSYETNSLPDSCLRLERMRTLIKANWGRITVETMKAILADHQGDPSAICRHGDRGMHSISGYIAEPAKGLLHIRRGHGCLGTWQAYAV
jgi:isopenicillin-N N-acyltransferase like protein